MQFKFLFLLLLVIACVPFTCSATTDYALQFNGANYVSFPADSAFSTNHFTFEAWVNSPNGSIGCTAFDASGGFDVVADSGVYLSVYVTHGGTYEWAQYPITWDTNWHFVSATYDNTTLSVFLDGALLASSTPLAYSHVSTFALSNCWAGGYSGMLDEVRVSNVARDIVSECSGGCPTSLGTDGDTVAYYNFNKGSGDKLYDSSGNGHDGTLTGDPLPSWVGGVAYTVPPVISIPEFTDEGGSCKVGQVCYFDWLIMNGFILFILSIFVFYPIIGDLFIHKKHHQ